MATGITIKRYNSTTNSWEVLNPATTIAQVDGLQTALNGKQATLTFDNSPTQSSNNPVKSGGVYSAIQDVANLAEGKTKSFVTTLVEYNSKYYILASNNSHSVGDTITRTGAGITALEFSVADGGLPASSLQNYAEWYCVEPTSTSGSYKITAIMGFVNSTVAVGDVLLITQTDVPDYWFIDTSGLLVSELETTKVDLSDYETSSHASSTYVAKTAGVTNVSWDSTNYKIQKTINSSTTDVVTLTKVATTGSYSDLTNKPTIPETNVIPSESTANKILLSTAEGGIAAWSSITIGNAAYKGVTDNSSATDVTSGDTNLITGRTLYYQLAKKGYTTNTGTVTSVGITTTANNGLSVSGTVTTSGNLSVGFASNHSSVLYADSEPSNKVSGQILFEY